MCCAADVHTTVLSVYMTDPKLPLPGADEVLLCTEHTTLEDVSQWAVVVRAILFACKIGKM